MKPSGSLSIFVCLKIFSLIVRPVGFGGSIDQAAILDFVDSGHDLIVAADVQSSDLIREIAAECGADFDEVPFAVRFHCLYLKLHMEVLLIHLYLYFCAGSCGHGH